MASMSRIATRSAPFPAFEGWPPDVRRLFWDRARDSIRPGAHRPFVIQRILSVGGVIPIGWLMSLVSGEELRRHLEAHRGREIAPRRLRYLELVLGLPKAEVSGWIRRQNRSPAPGRRRES